MNTISNSPLEQNPAFNNNPTDTKQEILNNFTLAKADLINKIKDKIHHTKYYQTHSDFPKMLDFVTHIQFDAFYEKFGETIANYTDEDYDSIGSCVPSKRTLDLIDCFEILNQNGFSLAKGHTINFWSGENAKKKAWDDISLCDSKIPAISVGFDICRAIQEIEKSKNYHILARKLPNIVSAVFSSLAKKEVQVFISSNKVSEPASIVAGNNFCSSELPIVQKLVAQNFVQKIWIHLESKDGIWLPPVDFNSQEADSIPVVRRRAYKIGNPDLDDINETPFVVMERWKNPAHFATWCATAPARPSITLGQLKKIAKKFKELSLEKAKKKL